MGCAQIDVLGYPAAALVAMDLWSLVRRRLLHGFSSVRVVDQPQGQGKEIFLERYPPLRNSFEIALALIDDAGRREGPSCSSSTFACTSLSNQTLLTMARSTIPFIVAILEAYCVIVVVAGMSDAASLKRECATVSRSLAKPVIPLKFRYVVI